MNRWLAVRAKTIRHRIDAPVDKNSQFGFLKPGRIVAVAEAIPGCIGVVGLCRALVCQQNQQKKQAGFHEYLFFWLMT